MRQTLVVVSDLHCGSTVGLCCPEEVRWDDGGYYHPSEAQLWLWENWLDFWRQAEAIRGDSDWFGVLVNGDAVDGDHHGTPQIISRDLQVQFWILKKVFAPVLALQPDTVTVVRGTETHVGKGGSTEEAFARWLKDQVHVPASDAEMYSHWYFRGMIGDCRIDATHHGRIGQRPWTKANAVLNLAAQIFYEYAAAGESHPHLAFRSHFHTFQDSHDAHPVRVIQTPAWQLSTAYAYRVVPESLADIGGIILTVEDGEYAIQKILYRPKRASIVRLA